MGLSYEKRFILKNNFKLAFVDTVPAKSSSSTNFDLLLREPQNAEVSCNDSFTQDVREFMVGLGAASNMVRMT
jgi:hypothetical protein